MKILKYWLASLIALSSDIFFEYNDQQEFYWFAVSILNKKLTLFLLGNFIISSFLLSIWIIQRIFFGKELMEGEKLIIMDQGRYKLMTLTFSLALIIREFNFRLVVFIVGFLTAWAFVWITNFRADHYPTQVQSTGVTYKQTKRNILLLVFYSLQISVYSYLIRKWFNVESLYFELVIFELGNIVLDLAQKGLKFLISTYEGITEASYTSKKNFFLVWDLALTLLQVSFQCYCLFRFTYKYNYPVFWARDILVSIARGIKLCSDYVKSLKMVGKVKRFKDISSPKEICGICLFSVQKGKQLPCKHVFHENCLIQLMQQPETAKKCPVCRLAIDKEGKTQIQRVQHLTDDERRVERLRRHIGTLKIMKIDFLSKILGFLQKKFKADFLMRSSVDETVGVTKVDRVGIVSEVLEKNFKNLVLGDTEDNQINLRISEGLELEPELVTKLSATLTEVLITKDTNFEGNFLNGVIIDCHHSEDRVIHNELRKLRMDILTHLGRIYRARKHLDGTAARNYFSFFDSNNTPINEE